MSAETDVALMMELEGKIDQRVKGVVYEVVTGAKPTAHVDNSQVVANIAHAIRSHLINDPGFISELTKRIGQKMQNIPY